jgi:hypothetical protein
MQQMPNEGRKFKAVDQTWRRTMEKMSKNPEVRVWEGRGGEGKGYQRHMRNV